jgi:hypothetical protein
VVVLSDNLSEVTSEGDSIANLVLDEAEISTLRALSTRHSSQRDIWAADFIEGKGTGQIILLHGYVLTKTRSQSADDLQVHLVLEKRTLSRLLRNY